jgi:hypothetical protein
MSEFLDSIEPLEEDLDLDIYAYVDPSTREVRAVWAYSLLGISEWDSEENMWTTVPSDDERVQATQDYVTYKVNWDNEESFDQKTDKSLMVTLFNDDKLTEDWLKQNTIFVKDENGQNPELSK